MSTATHSVDLISNKCIGCTDCIKRCPTEAIRVRNGKAVINAERCIDCGMCIKICKAHAKKAVTDNLSILKNYRFKVAIPAPTLYGQFKNIRDTNKILTGLKKLGFDEVFEVARAAELVTAATIDLIYQNDLKRPIISSACPVTVRLIAKKFPSLLENILPTLAPVEVASSMARRYVAKEYAIEPSDIGVFLISPCSAKSTNARNPLGIDKSDIDGVISMQDIYLQLSSKISHMREDEVEILAQSTDKGIDWALSGGESKEVNVKDAIAVDGIDNIIKVLEEVENGQLDVDFIECLSCSGGCIGGPLTVVNTFIANNNIRKLERAMRHAGRLKLRDTNMPIDGIKFYFSKKLEADHSEKLDEDMGEAIRKMGEINQIYASLPKINCGSCGAPTCMSLAEDIVQQKANIEDCIFMLRKRVRDLAENMMNLSSKMPQTLSEDNDEGAEIK